jgi:hypothetical protein
MHKSAAVLLAASACHPDYRAKAATMPTITLNGITMTPRAPTAQAQDTAMTGAAAGTLLASVLESSIYSPGDRAEAERALVRAYNAPEGHPVDWAGFPAVPSRRFAPSATAARVAGSSDRWFSPAVSFTRPMVRLASRG